MSGWIGGCLVNNGTPSIAIVDYGLGNIFSIKHACAFAGMSAVVTHDVNELMAADAVILPGVGAFGAAMDALRKKDLVLPILDYVATGKTLVGICLGMQLLLTQSAEFGEHKGLNLIKGEVMPLQAHKRDDRLLKVPQVGWNRIHPGPENLESWKGSLLDNVGSGEYMYFVHSYYVSVQEQESILSVSEYGENKFCSAVQKDNIIAFQFHPERSGPMGLKVYENLKSKIVDAAK